MMHSIGDNWEADMPIPTSHRSTVDLGRLPSSELVDVELVDPITEALDPLPRVELGMLSRIVQKIAEFFKSSMGSLCYLGSSISCFISSFTECCYERLDMSEHGDSVLGFSRQRTLSNVSDLVRGWSFSEES